MHIINYRNKLIEKWAIGYRLSDKGNEERQSTFYVGEESHIDVLTWDNNLLEQSKLFDSRMYAEDYFQKFLDKSIRRPGYDIHQIPFENKDGEEAIVVLRYTSGRYDLYGCTCTFIFKFVELRMDPETKELKFL